MEDVRLKKIDHINVVVSNLDEAGQFFTQLGFVVVGDEAELTGQWISSIVGLEDIQAKYVVLSLPGSDLNL